MSVSPNAFRSLRKAALASLLFGGLAVAFSTDEGRAQGMGNMPMKKESAQTATTASGTGTVTALNAARRRVTFDHGPMPDIKWPAMKMEFPVAPAVDLSKVKTGDKVRFTLSGSNDKYTVQSIAPAQ
jgi:Cu(I)/Ag(I) efflux system periplasmic protein CusF